MNSVLIRVDVCLNIVVACVLDDGHGAVAIVQCRCVALCVGTGSGILVMALS